MGEFYADLLRRATSGQSSIKRQQMVANVMKIGTPTITAQVQARRLAHLRQMASRRLSSLFFMFVSLSLILAIICRFRSAVVSLFGKPRVPMQ